jgi:hypothetical protein
MLLRGIAKGESTARLSRELDLDRKRLGEIRQQIQTISMTLSPAR